ncbi:dimethylaniline monooxygenase [N-oxide-forming] 2-like, partial [Aplysia californica]|uniref:Flavin-containing monooxygenase n=1 Tax=Aplysia californica TaxID=6500 RepID=A0ABM0KBH6_APLCA
MATKVLAGKVELPPQRKMRQCVDSLNEATLRRRKRYSYFLPGFKMMENIAVDLGVYPSFCTLLLRDPMLAWRVWYGPIYRLDRSHNTLLFVGQMGSDIALPPVSELQARMATK